MRSNVCLCCCRWNCLYTYIHTKVYIYIFFLKKYIPKLSKKCFENIECFFSICILCALAGSCARLKWLVSWPLAVLLYYTVPNCVLPRWHRWFMITFIASTLVDCYFFLPHGVDGKQRSKIDICTPYLYSLLIPLVGGLCWFLSLCGVFCRSPSSATH